MARGDQRQRKIIQTLIRCNDLEDGACPPSRFICVMW
jgi:hypothetical protein